MEILDLLMRIGISFICGCAIGSERQIHHRTAGLRTNVLVALGACSFTFFDIVNHLNYGTDLRVSAQIVSGIGFIGGGAILKDGFNIRGMTTAATLWCSGAAGMLSGMGYFWEALIIAFFVMLINTFMKPIVSILDNVSSEYDEYIIKISCDHSSVEKIKGIVLKYIEAKKIPLRNLKIHKGDSSKQDTTIDIIILAKKDKQIENMSHKIASNSKINAIMWEVIKG